MLLKFFKKIFLLVTGQGGANWLGSGKAGIFHRRIRPLFEQSPSPLGALVGTWAAVPFEPVLSRSEKTSPKFLYSPT